MARAAHILSSRVSIVVLTYNRCEEVCRTLRGLRALQSGHRIIVVDNGCTDDTASCVRRQFPDVTLVQAGGNLGAAGRNWGVELVRTPYVAFSDDDTCWLPGALEEAIRILDGHGDITVLNAQIRVGDDESLDPACAAMAGSPLPGVEGVGPELTGFMAGACVMRTCAYRRAGGYWPPLFIGGEEELLALDILADGGRIVYAPAVRTRHWPSTARDSERRRRLMARNALWIAWMRFSVPMAAARSVTVLRAVPTWRMRLAVCAEAMAGWAQVLRHRRVLDMAVCRKLQLVWEGGQPACRGGDARL